MFLHIRPFLEMTKDLVMIQELHYNRNVRLYLISLKLIIFHKTLILSACTYRHLSLQVLQLHIQYRNIYIHLGQTNEVQLILSAPHFIYSL